jgi:hypothetical protein
LFYYLTPPLVPLIYSTYFNACVAFASATVSKSIVAACLTRRRAQQIKFRRYQFIEKKRGDVMRKFVAFAVATLFTAGASIAMAQCPTCSGTAAPVFSSAQPVYAAPAPVYSQPVYSAPVAAPVYSAPVAAAPVYSQPVVSAPVYDSAPVSSCGCGSTGGEVVMAGGEATYTGGVYTSYGSETTLAVGAVINGETVVSVGESTIVETTDSGEGSQESNVIDGSVEPSPDAGEVVDPPAEESTPAPEETPSPEEATEGDA